MFGRLFHQYLVDQWAKIEMGRLNYYKHNQQKLRVDLYSGLTDVMNNLGETKDIGKTLLLPSSFAGGDRAMTQLYQDAMSIVRSLGKPDLFLTFTCNPSWPEIQAELLPNQKPNDRPDLISRIFKQKLDELFVDLRERHVLGVITGIIWVIEFQKRGLPHCHMLLILANRDKPLTTDDINRIVSAEIPDATLHPKAYETVKNCMLHGPCGPLYPMAPCMDQETGKCTKEFPKAYSEATKQNKNGYPIYQRSKNAKNSINKNGFEFDNSRVVPYNLYLCTKYGGHLNVEVCSSVTSVKYLFKYVYKGHDRVKFGFTENNEESKDEIKKYFDARFVSASEAAWRILKFPMSGQFPATTRLSIHLENQQSVVFKENQLAEDAIKNKDKTQLTEYFEYNFRYKYSQCAIS